MVNNRQAFIHGVPQGLLLVSPIAFKSFVHDRGSGDYEAVQRAVLAQGWQQRTLSRALDDASLEQIDRIMDVLERMQPLNTENEFWGRHALPQDVDTIEARILAVTDYLIEQRRPDAEVAVARLRLTTGEPDSRQREAFARASDDALGFTLPDDWTGRIQVQGNVHQFIDDAQHVTAAHTLGVAPQFWSVYAQQETVRTNGSPTSTPSRPSTHCLNVY